MIAEYAPVVHRQIQNPPSNQTSTVGKPGPKGKTGSGGSGNAAGNGNGNGNGNGGGGSIPPPGGGMPCSGIGSPPRTTPDPQSPVCVPWSGTVNGGATTTGVTADTIYVSMSSGNPNGPGNESTRGVNDWVQYFNSRFQLYGRRVVLNWFNPTGGTTGSTVGMSADAAQVIATHPFAEVNYYDNLRGQSIYFYDQLKAAGILSFQESSTDYPVAYSRHYTAARPYEWTYSPPLDVTEAAAADELCGMGLGAGHPAALAGGPTQQQPRTVGIAVYQPTNGAPYADDTALKNALAQCGGPTAVHDYYFGDDQTDDAQSTIQAMQADGVTTVICLCFVGDLFNGFMQWADNDNWFPEWFLTHDGTQDIDAEAQDIYNASYFRQEGLHTFGIRSLNKAVDMTQDPRYWAMSSVDSTVSPGEATDDDAYYDLLMLFTGIQYAGPDLTPQSFEEGMFRAGFPDPSAGAAPYYQARVGSMGPENHALVSDFAPFWWAALPSQQDSGQMGTFCYVDHGVRYSAEDRWPNLTSKLFRGQCY
ncbi:MAG: hypothetical protein ACYDAC_01590 [Candidatus Dormibacteria bacterium]